MRINRSDNHTQSSVKKNHFGNAIYDSSDDDKVNNQEDLDQVNNYDDAKIKEKGQHVDKVNKQYNPYVNHFDDFSDDEHEVDKKHSSLSKKSIYKLIDEDTDEEFNEQKKNDEGHVWVNINDLPWSSNYYVNPKNFIDDEAAEDGKNFDIHSNCSVSDEDEKDSFIDDESLGFYSTTDEDTDDGF